MGNIISPWAVITVASSLAVVIVMIIPWHVICPAMTVVPVILFIIVTIISKPLTFTSSSSSADQVISDTLVSSTEVCSTSSSRSKLIPPSLSV